MRAAVRDRYGDADVVTVRDVPEPVLRDDEIMVRVVASTVTTADWRLCASLFPRFAWLPGRLVLGFFRPRQHVLGVEYAGVVAGIGAAVSQFAVGDAVLGTAASGGGHAEYRAVKESSAVVKKPAGLSFAAAASLPFGGLTALDFLANFAKLESGQRVLVVGASGGVGVFAVQLAKQMGAHVTGVCSGANAAMVRGLGADAIIDYERETIIQAGQAFDVVLDTVGRLGFAECRPILAETGVFIPLEFDFREIFQFLGNRLRGGPRVLIGMSGERQADLQHLASLAADGKLRPVIDCVLPLDRIADGYRRTASRHKRGSVVIAIGPEDQSAGATENQSVAAS